MRSLHDISLSKPMSKYSAYRSLSVPGLQRKYWSPDGSVLYKCDSGGSPFGLVECLCSDMLDYADFNGKEIPHARYRISEEESFKNKTVTVGSENYCSSGADGFSLLAILAGGRGPFTLSGVIDTVYSKVGLDISDHLCTVMLVDYLFINRDRHWKNIAILADGNVIRPAPIYDNARAFDKTNIICPNTQREPMEFLPFGVGQSELAAGLAGSRKLRVNYSEFLKKNNLNEYSKFYSRYLVDSIPYYLDEVLFSCRHSNIEVV